MWDWTDRKNIAIEASSMGWSCNPRQRNFTHQVWSEQFKVSDQTLKRLFVKTIRAEHVEFGLSNKFED